MWLEHPKRVKETLILKPGWTFFLQKGENPANVGNINLYAARRIMGITSWRLEERVYYFRRGTISQNSKWGSFNKLICKGYHEVLYRSIPLYFILCPQIMLLTDPEVESSLLISSDEGATYQKYRLNFYILSLLFHPEQEDWILAYSHDQKVSEQSS